MIDIVMLALLAAAFAVAALYVSICLNRTHPGGVSSDKAS